MQQNVRTQRVGKLIQKELGHIFLNHSKDLLENSLLITVTEVEVGADLGLAKVYLSLFTSDDKQEWLVKISQNTKIIRKYLGERIGKKMRKVPELRFYLDDTVSHAAKIDELLNN